jgi:flagellar biosynthetic protein FliR
VIRAAPQLNLFGVGFTITLLSGFFALIVGLDGIMTAISNLLNSALTAVPELIRAAAAGAH